MLLKKLIKDLPKNRENIEISGISTNSKKIKKNNIFFALKGSKVNGEKFIQEAIFKGAAVIICSKSYKKINKKVLFIKKKDNLRLFLSEIASKFYNLKPKNIIAVTGTNGKTSVADTFYQIFRINNLSVASIGTLGIKYNGKVIKTNLTSPDTITLHKSLHFLKKKKVENVIIETSSHGLHQKRLNNIKFKGAIFTNFSQDHLDYHKTMKSYLNAKLILFREILKKNSWVITDKEIKPFLQIKKITKKKNLKLIHIKNELEKIKNTLQVSGSNFKMKNLAMASIASKLCGIKEKSVYKSFQKLKDINGRLELIRKYHNNIKVFIDYAHTPDALLTTLNFLKTNYGNNISLVFGCGGERDQKKRPLMARIADKYCKKIYITDDNPRNENPSKIRRELCQQILRNKVFNIADRSNAIKKAIDNSNSNEIILIAGKGHEEEQIYKDKIYKISDRKIIKKIKKNKISIKIKNYLQNKLIIKEILGKNRSVNFNGLTIDTRTIKKENLFLAIKGKNNDGNKFISYALKKGAGCIVSDKSIKTKNKKVLKTKNSISFLNNFAKLKREKTFASIIAITGSAGKTSLKNLIKDLLKNFGKTFYSPRSFNNHLGVPISLSNLEVDHKFGVFEVGMSKSGEIKNLTKLIKPQIGVITNVGEAHLENFKNTKEIARAKSEIIENLETGGTIILNRDDKFFSFLEKKAKLYKLKIITFGHHKKADVCVKKITKKGNNQKVSISHFNRKIDLEIKDLNIYNVLAAISVLNELNIDISKVKSKFKKFESPEGRGKKHLISRYNKKFKLIDESYNANPLSVKIAIKRLSLIKKESFKKYLILGDMLELGPKSKKYHEDISKVINNSDIDKVFVKGNEIIFTYKQLNKNKRGNILQNYEDIDISLSKTISNNDYLMIKGSNATGLNNLSKKMIKGA